MRTVGIDLSARDEHKAVIVDEAGHFVSPVFRFGTTPASLRRLLEMAQENNPDQQIQAVTPVPTAGAVWNPPGWPGFRWQSS
jgi:hypothetical protein